MSKFPAFGECRIQWGKTRQYTDQEINIEQPLTSFKKKTKMKEVGWYVPDVIF